MIIELSLLLLEEGDRDRPLTERIGTCVPEQAYGRRLPRVQGTSCPSVSRLERPHAKTFSIYLELF